MPVYHKIKFTGCDDLKPSEIMDYIHVWLEQKDSYGQINLAHFDPVIVQGNKGKS